MNINEFKRLDKLSSNYLTDSLVNLNYVGRQTNMCHLTQLFVKSRSIENRSNNFFKGEFRISDLLFLRIEVFFDVMHIF